MSVGGWRSEEIHTTSKKTKSSADMMGGKRRGDIKMLERDIQRGEGREVVMSWEMPRWTMDVCGGVGNWVV